MSSLIAQTNNITPPELLLPVPRQVRWRGQKRRRKGEEASGAGCFHVVLLVLGILVTYIAWKWIGEVRQPHPRLLRLSLLTIGGLLAGGIWWLLFLWTVILPYVQRNLLCNGKVAAGRIVKKRRGRAWLSDESHVDYEYDHPGLGRRTASMAIGNDNWNALAEGDDVTVLCYPHRRRPTLLYEYSMFECVPAQGAPRVKQPPRIPDRQPKERRDAQAYGQSKPYVFPPELQRPAPRPTIRRPGSLRVITVIGRILWVGIALIGLYLLARVPMYALVAYRGEHMDGQVVSPEVGKTRRGAEYRYVRYSFEAGGQRHEDSRDIDAAQYQMLTKGQKIPIQVRKFGGKYYSMLLFPGESKLGMLFGPFMEALCFNFLLTLGVGFLVWIIYWWQKRLCRWGMPVIGHITEKRIARTRKSTTYELHYVYPHPKLGTVSSLVTLRRSRWEEARQGQTVTILCYAEGRAHSSIIYEFAEFQCV